MLSKNRPDLCGGQGHAGGEPRNREFAQALLNVVTCLNWESIFPDTLFFRRGGSGLVPTHKTFPLDHAKGEKSVIQF